MEITDLRIFVAWSGIFELRLGQLIVSCVLIALAEIACCFQDCFVCMHKTIDFFSHPFPEVFFVHD